MHVSNPSYPPSPPRSNNLQPIPSCCQKSNDFIKAIIQADLVEFNTLTRSLTAEYRALQAAIEAVDIALRKAGLDPLELDADGHPINLLQRAIDVNLSGFNPYLRRLRELHEMDSLAHDVVHSVQAALIAAELPELQIGENGRYTEPQPQQLEVVTGAVNAHRLDVWIEAGLQSITNTLSLAGCLPLRFFLHDQHPRPTVDANETAFEARAAAWRRLSLSGDVGRIAEDVVQETILAAGRPPADARLFWQNGVHGAINDPYMGQLILSIDHGRPLIQRAQEFFEDNPTPYMRERRDDALRHAVEVGLDDYNTYLRQLSVLNRDAASHSSSEQPVYETELCVVCGRKKFIE